MRRQHTTVVAACGDRQDTAEAAAGGWRWPPRLIPVTWPGGEELLLVAALTPGQNGADLVPVARMPQLLQFGLWEGDHLLIPRAPHVMVRRTQASLHLSIGGQDWGHCTPAGPSWSDAGECLVGFATSIGSLRGEHAARAFTARLQDQQAVIASAPIIGAPLSIHPARRHGRGPTHLRHGITHGGTQ